MKTIHVVALLGLLLAPMPPASAIELSLEENRAERGSIGYIDMQRLFRVFPETVRAKENFEDLVRQAEEEINIRKAEILRLRNDLSQLKIEREYLAKTPVMISSTPPAKVEPKPEPKPEPPAKPAPNPGIAALPGFSGASSSPTVKAESLAVNIAGASTAPIAALPVAVASAPAVAPALAPVPSGTPLNPALVEIDAKIALKARDLAQKEADFKDGQAAAEKNLLDMESRKTEILLGKIYRAVQEVAHQEGVSVVVDKTNILYGHDAVDLTEKVLKHLKGT